MNTHVHYCQSVDALDAIMSTFRLLMLKIRNI